MYFTSIVVSSILALASVSSAAPAQAKSSTAAALGAKQQVPNACFVVGNVNLPQEVVDAAKSIQKQITCDTSVQVLPKIPDTDYNGIKFSEINFSKSKKSTLACMYDTCTSFHPSLPIHNSKAIQD